jgi:hypothetical protein
LGGEHADAAGMIFMDQFPELDHFTPVILGESNDTNVWNMFFRERSPIILLHSSPRKGRRGYDMFGGL